MLKYMYVINRLMHAFFHIRTVIIPRLISTLWTISVSRDDNNPEMEKDNSPDMVKETCIVLFIKRPDMLSEFCPGVYPWANITVALSVFTYGKN
jgi:hypothetical protein